MKSEVYWFRYAHENRNDLLRFGLMQLHLNGVINYIEKPLSEAHKFGFSSEVANGTHRHLSFLVTTSKGSNKKIIVDNEDSFVFTSNLISECDYYFSAGYNIDFFEKKEILSAYDWQKPGDMAWYNEIIKQKITELGEYFYKARKFIPITPNLSQPISISFLHQKLINIKSRAFNILYKSNYWKADFNNYALRYQFLKSLRNEKIKYDVTLNDSLWGWPAHRINLHNELSALYKDGYNINSILNWAEPSISDGSLNNEALNQLDFPIISGEKINDYEKMLAASKLGVFATGFHFGWRNIMTFCLMIGIPVLVDKLKLTPYFEMDKFDYLENEDHEWKTIDNLLKDLNEERWQQIKKKNQAYYDQVMSPISVANYFLNTITSS